MSSTNEQDEERLSAFARIKNIQARLAAALLSGLLFSLLLFDLLSVYSPGIMGSEIYPGSVYTIGILFAFCIIIAVVISAAYYVHRLNKAYESLEGEQST